MINKRNKKLTPEQKEFLRASIGTEKWAVLADIIGVSVDTLKKKCKEEGILHGRKKIASIKAVEEPIRAPAKPIPITPLDRSKYEYSNPTRDQNVERILNTKI